MITQQADPLNFRSPLRPNLIRFRPNTPTPSGKADVTRRKNPSNIGIFLGNPTLATHIILR